MSVRRRQRFFSILFALLLLATPNFAMADDGKAGVSQGVKADLEAQLKQRDTPKSRVEQPSSPTGPRAFSDTSSDKLSDDEVANKLAEIEKSNAEIIAELNAMIARQPTDPRAAGWHHRIAEYTWQRAYYKYLRQRRLWLKQSESLDGEALEQALANEPVPDYSAAIAEFRKIVVSFPKYDRIDEVLYSLGDALIRNGQAKQGVGYLHQLTQTHEKASDLDKAYFALGEYYFSVHSTGTAQAAYQYLLDHFPASPLADYARYKLAWTYINMGDEEGYVEAIKIFKEVVRRADEAAAALAKSGKESKATAGSDGQIDENALAKGTISFRNQALKDLISTYAQLPDGWREAKAYLGQHMAASEVDHKLEQLAAVLMGMGKFEEVIDLNAELIANDATNPHLDKLMVMRYEAMVAANQKDQAKAYASAIIDALAPDGQWYQQNRAEHADDARRGALVSRDFSALRIANALEGITAGIDKNRRAKIVEEMQKTANDLRQHIDRFSTPDFSQNSYSNAFYLAYLLDEISDAKLVAARQKYRRNREKYNEAAKAVLPDLNEAAEQYQRVIDMAVQAPEGADQSQTCANRLVFVRGNILATADPSWSIEKSASVNQFVEEKRDAANEAATPLSQQEADFIASVEQYSSRYPDDESTPAFLWRAAELYRVHNRYNEAASRFDDIISHFPTHLYAGVAIDSMFILYQKAENWAKIGYWASWLIDRKNFKHFSQVELEDAFAFAMDHEATDLAAAGDYAQAAVKLRRVRERAPQRSQLCARALWKAVDYGRQAGEDVEETLGGYRAALACGEGKALPAALRGEIVRDEAFYLSEIARYSDAVEKLKEAVKLLGEAEASADKKAALCAEVVETQAQLLQMQKLVGDDAGMIALLSEQIAQNGEHQRDLYRKADGSLFCRASVELSAEDQKMAGLSQQKLMLSELLLASVRNDIEGEVGQNALALLSSLAEDGLADRGERELALRRLIEAYIAAGSIKKASKTIERSSKMVGEQTAVLQAWLSFYKAEVERLNFENIALEFPVRKLRKQIAQKAKQRKKAEQAYKATIALKIAEPSTASALRLAEMALHFRDAFKALPIPPEVANDEAKRDEYTTWLEDELIYPAEDIASELLSYAHSVSLQFDAHNRWSKRTAKLLAELKPNDFPIYHEAASEHLPDGVDRSPLPLERVEIVPVKPASSPTKAEESSPVKEALSPTITEEKTSVEQSTSPVQSVEEESP